MRKSDLFLASLVVSGSLFLLMVFHAFLQTRHDLPMLMRNRQLVKSLDLTDLSLFTEARYMRHPSQSDLHSVFQDHPVSLEHFPAGSFGRGPVGIKEYYGKLR